MIDLEPLWRAKCGVPKELPLKDVQTKDLRDASNMARFGKPLITKRIAEGAAAKCGFLKAYG
jgi:hypothetical protein